ncbi:MAG: hypothetical protein Kow0069_19830 [Promethearchaeota archaeon]
MQKIRSGLFKLLSSIGILANEELFSLIAEETDIINSSLRLSQE